MTSKRELREMIKLRAWVVTRKRINAGGDYEVRKDDIYDAIAELANNSGYVFAPRPIVEHVRHVAREYYGKSGLPRVQL